MKKILFISPYPSQLAPSQRFRYEQYLSQLSEKGIQFKLAPFLTNSAYASVYQSGNHFSKISAIIYGYIKRFAILLHITQYDFIFIHREATPAGPPIIEWLIAKVFRKKIIYDFDDAIWLTDKTTESRIEKILRWRSKVSLICKWSYKVSCGNNYLADYARQFNNNVIVNPTTIDTLHVHNADLYPRPLSNSLTVIGWTGSYSTLKYLKQIEKVLKNIATKYPEVRFIVIADKHPDLDVKNLMYKQWTKESEIADLALADIGVMPLPDDVWAKGKCGFKALQYLALKIPAVVSPVGVNSTIVEHGIHGYCCTTEQEWFDALEKLILDHQLRKKMGELGREKVITHYSVSSNSANFLSLLE